MKIVAKKWYLNQSGSFPTTLVPIFQSQQGGDFRVTIHLNADGSGTGNNGIILYWDDEFIGLTAAANSPNISPNGQASFDFTLNLKAGGQIQLQGSGGGSLGNWNARVTIEDMNAPQF